MSDLGKDSRSDHRGDADSIRLMLAKGIELIDRQSYGEAIEILAQALEHDPESCEILTNLGAALALDGQPERALQHFDECLRRSPRHWPALANAASIRMNQGQSSWAVSTIADAAPLSDLPDSIFLLLVRAQIETKSFSKAFRVLNTRRHLLDHDPGFWLLFAVTHQYLNRTLEAEAAYRRLWSLGPLTEDQHARHGQLLAEIGDIGSARSFTRRALNPASSSLEPIIAHGRILEFFGETGRAADAYRSAAHTSPRRTDALINLGNMEKRSGNFADAERHYRTALGIAPHSAVAHKNLADLLGRTLRNDEAIEELRVCISLNSQNPYFHSDLLFAEHYSPHLTASDHASNAKAWGHRHTPAKPLTIPARATDDHSRLRIGLLSGSFRQHPVGFLALPGLETLNRTRFEIHCFANQVDEDIYTNRFRRLCDRWRAVAHLNDSQLLRLLRDTDLDILIEMAGHASGHRLPVIARRVAPVQIKWVGGQFDTMGIEAIDFFLSDPVESPKQHDDIYGETIHRLPNVYACYQAPEPLPNVNALPAQKLGHVTFGSLNKIDKISRTTVDLWTRCLMAVPNSRLILQSEPLADTSVVSRLHDQFSAHGIDPGRIDCRGFEPHPKLFETYHEIDIALDTTPYSGCLTTCEAMWMGVPVITLPGPTFAGRHSASFLTAVGLADWIASDSDAFVTLAQMKSRDLANLADLRSVLRSQMQQSPLCDKERFGRDLGNALEQMWSAVAGPTLR